MGDVKGFNEGVYPIVLDVQTKERVQLRDNAIEAVRQYFNRFIQVRIGKDFYFEVRIYPHHILRENKMLTGAGADRMQTGMSRAFGKSIGRAALVKPGQSLFVIGVKTPKQEAEVRKMIHAVKSRLPCKITTETTRTKLEEPIPA